ncbi:SAV_2336 N-terminal domain-related protein [Streptomyces sp. NPDC058701]|uniref:SAV_2336 N-terminal domain-related protein n=1 Tax=Streptomyces sp. NPDC058701 TaxID=3346608 RepID=UPI0036644EAA
MFPAEPAAEPPAESTAGQPAGPGADGPTAGPGAGPAAAEPGIRVLAGLLRAAGLDPSAEELADALWLAGRTREAAGAPPGGEQPGTAPAAGRAVGGAGAVGDAGPVGGPDGSAPGEEDPVPEEAEAEEPVTLYVPAVRGAAGAEPEEAAPAGEAVPVRVPGAAALPRILDVQRALRALQRHRPTAPPGRMVLDEPATAEAGARALGLVVPVLRAEDRREATVRLVMDASPSMAVWQEMFEELRTVCERLGAFRDVQVHHLHRLPDGTPALGRDPVPGGGMRSGDQLRDPTGRALTMVVSDCTGPLWREGSAQRLLYRWAECTPCVVVQPLPQRLWGRSWLPTERGTLARAGGAGRKLVFRPDRPPLPGRPTGGLPVPVLPPGATALGAWARLVAGLGTGPVPAEVGRVLADHRAAAAPQPRAVRPPRELVGRFRSTAAPRAVQLAVYLSAAPLTLPVMRLVQRTMLPDSEPSDLAEVLLSGLLRRSGPPPVQWYEFVPGVQDVLLGPLGRDEAALVLKHCSEYVLAHFGRGVRNFPALAVSQLTGAPPPVPGPGPREAADRVPAGRLPQAFAQVSAKVVRRYLPGPPGTGGPGSPPDDPAVPAAAGRARAVRAARDRLADGGGEARALYEAVAVLRRAVAVPEGPGDPPEEAETELAGALLRLWADQRDPEFLAEAERAVTGLRTAPARAVLGRVLYERALAGARPDAELLAAAEREWAAAGAVPGADRRLRRDCAVRRAEALIRLSGVRDDPVPLWEARAALEPLTGPPPPLAADLAPGGMRGAAPDGGGRPAGGGAGTGRAVRGTGGAPVAGAGGGRPGRGAGGGDGGPAPGLPGGSSGGARPAPAPGSADGPDHGGAGDGGPERGGPDHGGPDHGGPDRDSGVGSDGAAGQEAGVGTGAGAGPDPAPPSGDDPAGVDRHPALQLALGRVLLALLPRTPDAAERGALAEEAAARLASALDTPPRGGVSRSPRTARVRVELAGALRYLPARLEQAAAQLGAGLAEAGGDAELRVAALVCLGRVHRARYARDADPAALEDAAEAYGRARRLVPRDAEAFAELLPEWGDVLLDRARAADGRRFTGTAVRVLRESRAAVAQSDPGSAHRLVRLATGLRLRHAYEGDPVDLREAEYLLELAVRQSRGPLEQARAWRDHGDVQQEIHGHTRAAERLDRAADSYRRAWRAALEADRAERADTAVRLAARVQELRGAVLERLARPRAALDAYRAALDLWQRLEDAATGDGTEAEADDTTRPEAVRARVRALEAGP